VDNDNWQIEPPSNVTSGSANYIMLPATGASYSLAANASVVVQIYNFATVENPGNSLVAIKEVAISGRSAKPAEAALPTSRSLLRCRRIPVIFRALRPPPRIPAQAPSSAIIHPHRSDIRCQMTMSTGTMASIFTTWVEA
jgi:hypothetical protein